MNDWIFAIDPGTTQSAWVIYRSGPQGAGVILSFGKHDNAHVLDMIHNMPSLLYKVVIEQIVSYGMPVGAEVFETVWWTGRFSEAAINKGMSLTRIPRKRIVLHLCNNPRGNDASVRQALIDRFGPGKEKAIGKKANPGPLYGVSGDVWAALGVAVTYSDKAGV